MEATIGEILSHRAYLSPNLEAVVCGEKRFTYEQLNVRVNQFAAFLLERNCRIGDRIGLLCKNHDSFLIAFYAAAKIGVITVPINWRLHPSEIDYILENCEISVLIYDSGFSGVVEQLSAVQSVHTFVQVGDTAGKHIKFEASLTGRPTREPDVDIKGEQPAVIMYTSGTTGKPKGAILSHNNFFSTSVGTVRTIDWRYGDRFLSMTPAFHIGGVIPLVTCVHTGNTICFMPDFNPIQVWQTVQDEKINLMMSVPVMLQVMLQVPQLGSFDKSSIRSIICGASPVPETVIRTYYRLGIKVEQVYGITEYSGAVTFWTHEMGLDNCASMGKSVFHGTVKIVDPVSGADLPAGKIGEIVCKGPQVFSGYWRNPEATEKTIKDGWLHTGDLGKLDEKGFLYVIDRLKDMIISGGENIYSAELEAVIAALPNVAEVAVIGVVDDTWGEVPKAFIVKVPGTNLNEQEVLAFCAERLPKFKIPKYIEFIDALPRNAVGKILKTALRNRAR
ncbi:class I adenylate-forming enzyme family protein [Effusibacillus pohliae]|uniref:class I adenylate-forming enzyme family protein n=1 Tax=Effusibacillus pohliae TaxID=232270 RepID=UPI00035E086E|nr:long-chain fatty acid--CoA ligase [Effusibacillus pohliae]